MTKAKKFKKPKRLKMSKRSEKALDKSIEHWEKDIRDKNEAVSPHDCPLCMLYNNDDNCFKDSCYPCPVNVKVEGTGCSNNKPIIRYEIYRGKNEPKRKRLAQAEIEFLQSCYY